LFGSVLEIWRFSSLPYRVRRLPVLTTFSPRKVPEKETELANSLILFLLPGGSFARDRGFVYHTLSSLHSAFIAHVSYEGRRNFNAISKSRWIGATYPNFTESNTDFVDVWRDTVQYVYPTAQAKKGWITKDTLNNGTLSGLDLQVVSIDSAKGAASLHAQLAGLTLPAGAILFLMDFEFVHEQIKQTYACLRDYLLPVYVSWNMEHWAWVVTKSFNINDPVIFTCYKKVAEDVPTAVSAMKRRLGDDLMYLSGLTDDVSVHEHYAPLRDRLNKTMHTQLDHKPGSWNIMARLTY
jgi:hypothetical protein